MFAVSWATWLLFPSVYAPRGASRMRCPGALGSCSPVCSLGGLRRECGVLGHSAPLHGCAHSACSIARAVSWATWLLISGVYARRVVLRVCVLSHLAPVHRCARLVCTVACAVSWATWLLFTGLYARCVVLRVRCPGPLGSYSPVTSVGVLCRVCSVLSHSAPVHRCARLVCSVACVVSWATWLLSSGVYAWCVVLHVRCPGPLGSFLPVTSVSLLCRVCGVLSHVAAVHRCARSACGAASAVSLGTWLLSNGVHAWRVPLHLRCAGALVSRSPVCLLGPLCCLCRIVGNFAPVPRCARSVCCVACAVSWATWLLFTAVLARGVLLRVRCLGHLPPVHRCARSACFVLCVPCPGSLGSCLPLCTLGVLCCVSGVLAHLAPVQRCAPSVRCGACAVAQATWLLFSSSYVRCVVLRVRCCGPLGSCLPVCSLGALRCVSGVLADLAPVHRCARSAFCVACAVSCATRLLFTGVYAPCNALHVRVPEPLASCYPVCSRGALRRVCGVLGHLAPVHRCARSTCCVACAVSWATWLLFTGVHARRVLLCVRCLGPLGSC